MGREKGGWEGEREVEKGGKGKRRTEREKRGWEEKQKDKQGKERIGNKREGRRKYMGREEGRKRDGKCVKKGREGKSQDWKEKIEEKNRKNWNGTEGKNIPPTLRRRALQTNFQIYS